MNNDDKYIIYDIHNGKEVTRISLSELTLLLLIREDDKLLEKYVFRDKQGEKY